METSETVLYRLFSEAGGEPGCVQHVKKIRDYAFIHFWLREHAARALQKTNGNI